MKNLPANKNLPRQITLWGVLVLLVVFLTGLIKWVIPAAAGADVEAYCPMGGLQALATYVVRGSLPCSMTSLQIMMGVALALAVIVFSKLFCGYLCPVGAVEMLMIRLRRVLRIKAIEIRRGGTADKLLRCVKYLLAAWIFYMTCTASELYCKNLDPYYAVATGFKGEITLWMSITTIALVLVGGFLIDNFWCKYFCPLGAVSNILRAIPLGIEKLFGKKKAGLAVWWDENECSHCQLCVKHCPYGIDASTFAGGKVTAIDCTLCGECIGACNSKALSFGVSQKHKGKNWRWIPAIIAVVVLGLGIWAGKSMELPTINVEWGMDQVDGKLKEMRIDGLKTVKCYGSSMAFKARAEKIRGVHGVRTYVGDHHVVLKYDPSVVTPEQIEEALFVPSHFRVMSPDPAETPELKVQTIRVEKMYDKMSLNYLGLQMRLTGKKIYGVDSQYDCPVRVRVYMDPSENLDKNWYKEVVNKKTLDMPVHGGGVKQTPVDLEFVSLEKEESTIGISDYLHMMFDGFKAEFNGRYPQGDSTVVRKRSVVYEGKPQYIYEIEDQDYEKPVIRKALPFISNWVSSVEGVISFELCLSRNLVPCMQIRYADPVTEDLLWDMLTSPTWKITYSKDDVREEPARLKFTEKGHSFKAE